MSEAKKERSLPEIQTQYAELCTRAGHIQYQISALSKDLDLVNEELRKINLEAYESKKAEDAAKEEKKS